ncbi:MAG: PilZ domain-containing protein [Candidatus Omnitrophica bacterium]|nr:PilZ domain-containing protein [Candidatus Omnitrophota bacterium]
MYEEKRKYKRVDIELPALYRIKGSDMSLKATIVNISPEGLQFLTQGEIDIGTEVELKVQLHEKNNVSLNTRVVWAEYIEAKKFYGNGVKIINVDDDDEQRFIKFYCQKVLMDNS